MSSTTSSPCRPTSGCRDRSVAPARLAEALGDDALITDPSELRTYECDGLAPYRVTPDVVVLASTARDIHVAVRLCAQAGVPFVARGSGTGFRAARCRSRTAFSSWRRGFARYARSTSQPSGPWSTPGSSTCTLASTPRRSASYYAPDPSSQVICSIGGNVAENSGGDIA